MEEREYAVMHACEDEHWWYRGLRRLIKAELKFLKPAGTGRIADIGCGTGRNLQLLSQLFPAAKLLGLDLHPDAVKFSQSRRLSARLIRGSANELPVSSGSFEAVLLMDVLYIREVEEKKALEECLRILKPGGILLVNVPAFECLRGSHDRAVHTRTRYRRRVLKELLKQAGFNVRKMYYWNSMLFPLIFLKRRIRRFSGPEKSDVGRVPKFWNTLLSLSLFLEQRLSRRGFFSFGTSLFVVCEKPSIAA